MSGQFHERRIFPSGDFAQLPSIGARRRRRIVTIDRIACVMLGAIAGVVAESLLR
jgi:hypothetical protein